MLEANLTTTMLCTKYCIPEMKKGGGGSIIMVSSIAGAVGLMGSAGAVAYSTAKAGLHGFTQSVAADYATQNIRANCIIVGSVHTPMVAHLGAEARERRKKMVPMQTEGTAWDIAYGAVYLASRRIALGDRRAAADRRRPGGAAAMAALGPDRMDRYGPSDRDRAPGSCGFHKGIFRSAEPPTEYALGDMPKPSRRAKPCHRPAARPGTWP